MPIETVHALIRRVDFSSWRRSAARYRTVRQGKRRRLMGAGTVGIGMGTIKRIVSSLRRTFCTV